MTQLGAANHGKCRVALEEAGFAVVRARNGVDALEVIARTPVGPVLLDNRYAEAGWAQRDRSVRADPATDRLPIIMVTAEGDLDARIRGLDAGG